MSEGEIKNDEFWRKHLSDEEFAVCRQKGTERPFSGKYNDFKETGQFLCKCCAEPLFLSAGKYDSGSGWPSFFSAINDTAVSEHFDESLGMRRTEIMCNSCGSHLGHVFSDGPKPTGLRYCVNSLSLNFRAGDTEGEPS